MYTKKPFDHDTLNPGPTLDVNVECRVKNPQNVVKVFEDTVHVTILDRNDNPPVAQENKILTINLIDPHFQQVRHKFIFKIIIFSPK